MPNVKEVIELKPDYPNVARWLARALAEHGFDQFNVHPVISLIEHVRYLDRSDPAELEKILEELRAKGGKQ